MKLRRVSDEVGFCEALVASSTSDGRELPVWISPAAEITFAAKIDPVIARIPVGSTFEWADPASLADLRGQLVLGLQGDVSGSLAECYARCLMRPFLKVDRSGSPTAHTADVNEPRITLILPVQGVDSQGFIDAVRSNWERRIGEPVALGILAADTLQTLTWLLIKQIRGWRESDRRVRSVTLIGGELSGTVAGLRRTSPASRADLIASLHGCDAALLMQTHARPHCGVVSVADGMLGICGSPTQARAGKCFDDKPCLFGSDPKVLVEEVESRRVFYNGCSTATLDGTSFGIPRSASLVHAGVRGYAAEWIGKVRFGLCSEMDFSRFAGLCSLGFPPAAAVEVLHLLQSGRRRHPDHSFLYIGDAANPAWPISQSPTAEVEVDGDVVRLTWREIGAGAAAARLPSRIWGELATEGLLDVQTLRVEQDDVVAGEVIPDPWADATLVLLRVKEPLANLTLELSRGSRLDRSVGRRLQQVIDEIDFLYRVGTFGELASDAHRRLSRALANLRRIAQQNDNIVDTRRRATWLERAEVELSHFLDQPLIEEACRRASSRDDWYWSHDAASQVSLAPIDVSPEACPLCGRPAFPYSGVDLQTDLPRRVVTICTECGTIADLPTWPLDAHLIGASARWDHTVFRDRMLLRNRDSRVRRVTTGIALDDHAEAAGAPRTRTIEIAPGEALELEYAVSPEDKPAGFEWARVFIASEGAFGYVARPFIF